LTAILNLKEPNQKEIIQIFTITRCSLQYVGFAAVAIKNV